MFEQPKTKIQIGALFGCISDSLQPLAVHSHQLLCVQPNDSGKRNTAKSCTEYSQYICSVLHTGSCVAQINRANFFMVSNDKHV